nr:amidase [uncultured Lichenicoccus sp.]
MPRPSVTMLPRALLLLGVIALTGAAAMPHANYDVQHKGISDVARDMQAGHVTSAALVRAYLARIAAIDHAGPSLHSVIALNPQAEADAVASDKRRHSGAPARALEGVPILVKDNIETADAMPTTAGSLALAGNVTHRDAPLVARLRAAGAIILGKTNLSEWANMRSSASISGWSGVGGLTRNPYALDRSACGSSSGSAAAVAASLAPAAIGTETDGSITCPASLTGLVGLKPTVGLVSRTHVVPLAASQDTAGPITHTVADAALLASVLAGSDPADPVTVDADAHRPAAIAGDAADALKGRRIGVLRFLAGHHAATDIVFGRALDRLRDAGATLVEIKDGPDLDAITSAEMTVLLTEFKTGLDSYLASTPDTVKTRTMADVIALNEAQHERELGLFNQDLMVRAQATAGLTDAGYRAALSQSRRMAGPDGLDRLQAQNNLDAMVAPTGGPAWVVDLINGDHDAGSASTLPAVAGTPHLTVPMGDVDGLPVGLSFIGPRWSEQRLLEFGTAYEAAAGIRQQPRYLPSLPATPAQRALLLPADGPSDR